MEKTFKDIVLDHYFGKSRDFEVEGHVEKLVDLFLESLPFCEERLCGGCGRIATWQSYDQMGCEYVCERHKETRSPWSSRCGWVPFPLGQQADALLKEMSKTNPQQFME